MADKAEKAEKKEELPCDKLRIGDIIYWYNRGMLTNSPCPAIILHKRGNGVLMLSVQTDVGPRVYDAVKHYASPELNRAQLDQRGCWSTRDEKLDFSKER